MWKRIALGRAVRRTDARTQPSARCRAAITQRGWVVLTSDSSHYCEHMETNRIYTTTFHPGEVIDGYARLRSLADSPRHIIPGHDPLVMQRYPASDPSFAGIAVRLYVSPIA